MAVMVVDAGAPAAVKERLEAFAGEVLAAAMNRPVQRVNIPAPQLVRSLGEQLRALVGRVGQLVAALAHPAVAGGQQPVRRALRRQVAALVEQRRPDLRGRAVNEPLRMQLGQDGLALGRRQRSGRHRSRPMRPGLGWASTSVDRRRCRAQRPARRPGADDRRELINGLLDHRAVLPGSLAPSVPSSCSKSAETFP